ncbi:asparagine synthase (glutamine-hydrolyzing) [Geomonas paludis]|uniref:asparagine synthase (glutamine-hydrolyzing) n=1 Tax=Geomonas paludis TaxID=2740185 RepID=A0A6V8MX56_9BACT|nr:asparagine synthase (glutamine-hydrolyzing) [Geomonas paludis]GFO63829.1 asparagine synthetase B [Geomonas paludis]
MCGIAGIIHKNGAHADAPGIERMLSALVHRGPDDAGTFLAGNLALGHRRLSILDVSEAGHQPMRYKEYVIAYNGEVYNYLELREELAGLGHHFLTGTDTEVILHAYEQWGEGCLERFEGMWAFALYDGRAGRLFCSRDRFGIKPFYYYEDDERLLFASEIKALLAAGVPSLVNREVLLTYLVVGFINYGAQTFFSGVHQLLPGRNLRVELYSGRSTIERYYDLSAQSRPGVSPSDYIDCIRNSVRLHLRSDVPVGTCLSGGLDSSVVAALAAPLFSEAGGARSFGAVTAVSQSKENDESGYARQVAEHCRLDWYPVQPTFEDFQRHVEDCLLAQGEPVGGPSLFMQYWVMKKAREAGFKVMLDGQGGDETLLGYERYYPGFFLNLAKRGRVLRLCSEYLKASRNSRLSLAALTSYTVYFLVLPVRKRILEKRASFVKKGLLDGIFEVLKAPARAFFNLRSLQDLEIGTYQMPNLLLYEDRNSMAHSIEARVPYVERNCIETAVSLAPGDKIRDGFTKHPLRLLADAVLPRSVAWRTNKIGFEAPTSLWLGQHATRMQSLVDDSPLIRSICQEVPRLESLSLDHRWRLYNIAVWERQYRVSDQAAPVGADKGGVVT